MWSIKRIIPFVFIVFLLGWDKPKECAAQTDWSVYEQTFLSLINEARQHPLETAKSMGLDPDKLLNDLAELRDILLNGLPPLAFNQRLGVAASTHSKDMAARGYYSHVSKDGRTWEERILGAGYVALASGESLGMVNFNNYLPPSDAVEAIFKNIFQDELNPDRKEGRNILSPEYDDAGVGMSFGVVFMGNVRFNAYLITCNFGKSAISALEDKFMDLVNEARRAPLETAIAFGLDPEGILAAFPGMEGILKYGLPPLQSNRLLNDASEKWLSDVISNGFVFSFGGDEELTVKSRLVSKGYLPLAAEGFIGVKPLSHFAEPESAIIELFEEFFRLEMDPGRSQGRIILNESLKEASVSLGVGEVALRGEEAPTLSYAIAMVGGADAAPEVETRLLVLMNRARANPYEVIREAGFDIDLLKADLPWLRNVIAEGLPDLWHNQRLRSAARAHSVDMAARKYFSSVTPEGYGHGSRISRTGYEASCTGEAVGVHGYEDQAPGELAEALFREMLAVELDKAAQDKQRIIFGAEFTEVGIGIGGADLSLDGVSGPCAIVTVDVAARLSGQLPREAAESLFLELVNEARADPLGMAAAMGLDPGSILALVRGWGEGSLLGLGPVYPSEKLWMAAGLHAEDMASRGYFSHFGLPEGTTNDGSGWMGHPGGPVRPGPPGKGVKDRIIEQGYSPVAVGEFLAAVKMSEEAFPEGSIIAAFTERFLLEINPQWPGERLILGPLFREIGIGLMMGSVVMDGRVEDLYLIVADFATSYERMEGSLFEVKY